MEKPNLVYMGPSDGEPIFFPKQACSGCDDRVVEPTDCPLAIEQCPMFGTAPDAAFCRTAVDGGGL